MESKNTVNECASCDNKKNKKDGICIKHSGSDGLPIMCTGKWSEEKHFYIDNFLNLFFRAMYKKWAGNLCYVDLFCGPGRCRTKKTGNEFDGSPLIALKYQFSKYIFVDKNEENINTLNSRTVNRAGSEKIVFIRGDCNDKIDEIRHELPKNSLSVVLVDPFKINFNFDSFIKLTNDRRMDLIIVFPLGMTIKRIMNKSKNEKAMIDNFLGGSDWQSFSKTKPGSLIGREITDYFKNNLANLGYRIPKEFIFDEITVKNTKNAPLYKLLFASKDPLGNSFWNKIIQSRPNGQLSLFS